MLPSAATCRVEYVLPVGAHTEHHVQHKFTYGIGDSLNVLGLKGTLKIRPWSNLSDMGKDIFHRIRLLNTLSNLILNTTNDRVSTVSLGNLYLCLNTLIAKIFFLYPF